MKKICSVLLVFIVLLSLSACGKKPEKPERPTLFPEEETTERKTASLKDTVTIRLPITMLEEQYRNDLDAYCEKYGYIKANFKNGKSEVEITMNSFSHELLLTQIGLQVLKAIAEVTDSGEYPAVKELKSIDRNDFRFAEITVDAEKYEKDGSKTAPYIIGQSCLLYQVYTVSDNYRCEVKVIDEKTGKTIETKVYTDKDE